MRRLYIYILFVATAFLLEGCCHKETRPDDERNVMILYSAGCNSLSAALQEDIKDLTRNPLPFKASGQDVVLVFSKRSKDSYRTQTSPVLMRLYDTGAKDEEGKSISAMDTLLTLSEGTVASSAETMTTVLNYIKQQFPAKSYGLIFSSHGRGWLPPGFYTHSSRYENYSPALRKSASAKREQGWGLPRIHEPLDIPEGMLLTKTIGEDLDYSGSERLTYEMHIEEFAQAIPFKLDYILFDACLMGGIELAYALRDVTDYVGFSQAEILSDGFDYTKIVSRLANNAPINPLGVCEDYFSFYDNRTDLYHSATISLIDTGELGKLASVCQALFSKYRSQLSSLDYSTVQGYGGTEHWFFDLEDILLKAGISPSEQSDLSAALTKCVPYKGCTGQYYSMTNGVNVVEHFSGLSMYLPSAGMKYLDDYYKDLSWNKATGLVR